MQKLTWDMWRRTPGCRHWMDVTTFAGASFTDIFYRGMRTVFMDEKGHPGLIYQGQVWPRAEQIIASNGGKRVGFTQADEAAMLRDGLFKYDNTSQNMDGGQLIFSGPDADDLQKPQYMETTEVKQQFNVVEVQFYNIARDAAQGTGSFAASGPLPASQAGVNDLGLFVGALVLHEIVHHHGFHHTHHYDSDPGSDYSLSLPVLAWRATMEAGMGQSGFFSGIDLEKIMPPRCSISS